MVECLTRDRGAAGSSLTGVTALCPWARHIKPSLVLVQHRKTRPYITERLLMARKESNQTNKQNTSGVRCSPVFINENYHQYQYDRDQLSQLYMSCCPTKDTSWHARPSKTQNSLLIRAVWLNSLMGALWIATCPIYQSSGGTIRLIRLCGRTDWFESSLDTFAKLYLMLDTGSYGVCVTLHNFHCPASQEWQWRYVLLTKLLGT